MVWRAYEVLPPREADQWGGLSVVAFDGATDPLPTPEAIRQAFDPPSGLASPSWGLSPPCLVTTVDDVGRRRPIGCTICALQDGDERAQAQRLRSRVPPHRVRLFDRGCPSDALLRTRHQWNTFYMAAVIEQLKQAGYPVHDSDLPHVWPTRYAHLNVCGRLKWFLWHENVYQAFQVMQSIEGDLEVAVAISKDATTRKLLKAVEEFHTYIENNANFIPNYGECYRNGERISTGFVESTVNQVISKRMVKKQQMQWSQRGAHLLLRNASSSPRAARTEVCGSASHNVLSVSATTCIASNSGNRRC